jgi:protein-tyrosine-phosphatase
MERTGKDLSNHKPSPISAEDVENATYIIAVDDYILSALRRGLPYALQKILMPRNIMDPYCGSRQDYEDCINDIERLVNGLIDEIQANT